MTDRRAEGRTASAPAAQSGAGDIALFGAIPIAFAGGPALAEGGTLHVGRAAASGGDNPDPASGSNSHNGSVLAADDAHGAIAGHLLPGTNAFTLHAPVFPAPAAAEPSAPTGETSGPPAGSHVATFVPATMSHAAGDAVTALGTIAAAPIADSAPATASAPATIGVDDAVATIRASAASLHEAISVLADRLQAGDGSLPASGVASVVEGHLHDVEHQAAATVSHVGDLGAAAGQIKATVAEITGAVHEVTQTAIADVSQTIDRASSLTGAARDAATDIADRAGELAANATDHAGAAVADLTEAVTDTADHARDAATDVGDRVGEIAANATGHAGAAAADLTEAVTDTADHARDAATDVADRVGEIAVDATGHAGAAITDLTGEIADATHHANASATGADALAPTTHEIASTVTAVDHTVSTVTGTLGNAHHLDGVGGSDPAGGVATLVGMVSAADAFDLHDSGAAHDLAPAMGALGSADFLAEVAPSEALLGIHGHEDDVMSGMTDHLHDGLFGHG